MVRKIQINLTNKWFYTFVAIIAVLTLTVGIYAFDTSDPPTFGHSAGEIEGVCWTDGTNCPAGTVDTRCDTSGTCSQVCIGADCQTTWPSGGSGGIMVFNELCTSTKLASSNIDESWCGGASINLKPSSCVPFLIGMRQNDDDPDDIFQAECFIHKTSSTGRLYYRLWAEGGDNEVTSNGGRCGAVCGASLVNV